MTKWVWLVLGCGSDGCGFKWKGLLGALPVASMGGFSSHPALEGRGIGVPDVPGFSARSGSRVAAWV